MPSDFSVMPVNENYVNSKTVVENFLDSSGEEVGNSHGDNETSKEENKFRCPGNIRELVNDPNLVSADEIRKHPSAASQITKIKLFLNTSNSSEDPLLGESTDSEAATPLHKNHTKNKRAKVKFTQAEPDQIPPYISSPGSDEHVAFLETHLDDTLSSRPTDIDEVARRAAHESHDSNILDNFSARSLKPQRKEKFVKICNSPEVSDEIDSSDDDSASSVQNSGRRGPYLETLGNI